MIPGYIGLKEWAARLGIKRRRANALVKRIPDAIKDGPKWYLPNDVGDPRNQRWVKNRKQTTPTDIDLDAIFGTGQE